MGAIFCFLAAGRRGQPILRVVNTIGIALAIATIALSAQLVGSGGPALGL
jgi:Na+-driven multidrug efflux pump